VALLEFTACSGDSDMVAVICGDDTGDVAPGLEGAALANQI